MQINFFKQPLAFTIFLIIGAQIVNINRLPIPITFFPKRIFAFIISILISYFYTKFYKFKFSSNFIFRSLVWHFIFCFTIPALLLLTFADIKTFQLIYLKYAGLSGCIEQEIFISLVTFMFYYAILFLCCWLGNRLALWHITKDKKPIDSLQEPLLFASIFVFMLYLITSSIRTSLINNSGNIVRNIPISSDTSALLLIYAGKWDVSLLLFTFIASLFIAFFSFAYTWLYQKKMSVLFKIYTIIEIFLLIFLFKIISILSDPCGFSYLLEQMHHFSGTEFVKLLIDLIKNVTNLKIFIAMYLLISCGNRLALWLKR